MTAERITVTVRKEGCCYAAQDESARILAEALGYKTYRLGKHERSGFPVAGFETVKQKLGDKGIELDIVENEEAAPEQAKKPEQAETTILMNKFRLAVDGDGNILTDLELLKALREERLRLARRAEVPAFHIFTNRQLVLLATHKPTTEEAFVALTTLGSVRWNKYGPTVTEIIKQFC